MDIKRKLYPRGNSFETTIPRPLLFSLNLKKKHNIVFKFDQKQNKWFVDFEETK